MSAERPRTAAEHLAVPYLLTMMPVLGPDGHWICQVEYPELPGCRGEAFSPIEALDRLENARVELILYRLARGEAVPTPRPPLAYLIPEAEQRIRDAEDAVARYLLTQS